MVKLVLLFGVVVVAFVADVTCQRLTQPTSTYRPPNRGPLILPTYLYKPPVTTKPIIRTVRAADVSETQLWEGEPVQTSVADESSLTLNREYRSVDSPSARRHGGHSSSGSRGDTGPTHPGYNRRNARAASLRNYPIDPHRPWVPSPFNPRNPKPGYPRGPYPIYARTVRDIHLPGMTKPKHRDVIIPNWNPNARTQPWQRIG